MVTVKEFNGLRLRDDVISRVHKEVEHIAIWFFTENEFTDNTLFCMKLDEEYNPLFFVDRTCRNNRVEFVMFNLDKPVLYFVVNHNIINISIDDCESLVFKQFYNEFRKVLTYFVGA